MLKNFPLEIVFSSAIASLKQHIRAKNTVVDHCLASLKAQISVNTLHVFLLVGQNCGNCTAGQIRCTHTGTQMPKCINRTQVCDQNIDCPNKEDELNCAMNTEQIFYCAHGLQYIEKYKHCDSESFLSVW